MRHDRPKDRSAEGEHDPDVLRPRATVGTRFERESDLGSPGRWQLPYVAFPDRAGTTLDDFVDCDCMIGVVNYLEGPLDCITQTNAP